MVFGTEDDLMEMQMSSKSQSFSRPTWYSALSTIASGVGAAEFLEDVLLHRAGVYADADRQMRRCLRRP